MNRQTEFSANTPTIPESSQINYFLTWQPEIPRFEPRKIFQPSTHQTTQTLFGNKFIRELERVIEKGKPKEEIVPDQDISFTLSKISTILDDWIFEKEQEKKREKEEQIKSKIDLKKKQKMNFTQVKI